MKRLIFRDNSQAHDELCKSLLDYKNEQKTLDHTKLRVSTALQRLPVHHGKARTAFFKCLDAGKTDRALKLTLTIKRKSLRNWVYLALIGLALFGFYAEIFM